MCLLNPHSNNQLDEEDTIVAAEVVMEMLPIHAGTNLELKAKCLRILQQLSQTQLPIQARHYNLPKRRMGMPAPRQVIVEN